MTAAPAPRTWANGEKPDYQTWNQELYDTWVFLLNPPMVKARQTTAQSIPTSSWTALNFQTEDVDTHGFHSATVNPSRFTPTVPGFYVGYAGVSWVYNATTNSRRMFRIQKNGTTAWDRADTLAPNLANANLVVKGVAFGPLYCNGTTDYVEVYAYQDSGAAINTDVGSGTTDYEEQPEFYMRWYSK